MMCPQDTPDHSGKANAANPAPPPALPPVMLQHGFRPFFLLAGLYAAALVPLWLGAYLSGVVNFAWPAGLLHGHEMVFGFATAAFSGFLLTAVPNWEGSKPCNGNRLAVLVGLWIAGRIAIWSALWLPGWLVAIVDISYLPALAIIGIPELIKSPSKRNKVFLALLTGLTIANALVHMKALGFNPGASGNRIGLDLLIVMIAIIGGRVVPTFTQGALRSAGVVVRAPSKLDALAIAAVIALVVADAAAWLYPGGLNVVAIIALIAGVLNALRMRGWGTLKTLAQPIVWILHLGFAWLAFGLMVRSAYELLGLGTAALHGMAAGAIGTMTLAIMSRAALGHSGRALVTPRPVVLAYVLVSIAALSRLAQPLMGTPALIMAAAAWTAAF
ncbi:MAG: NnrS family protein, partial [Rhodospirillaceae bacterium]|nr:NnrS family protein [Rhodospirillaceae bacterium]